MTHPDDLRDTPDAEHDGFRPRATDLLRKALLSGVGALFMTEEGVRSLVKDLKLPKEVLAGALAQAERTKGEVVRMVGAELRAFLQSSKVREDLLAMLSQLTFEVRAEVAIKPRSEASSAHDPAVKVTVKRKTAAKRVRRPAGTKAKAR